MTNYVSAAFLWFMSNKIKRNDPCPCGSGKKFKNCCLVKGDNLYAFPGHDATHGDIERYQRFVDNWDESQGQPPSFMQFLGRANAATEYLNDIQESIGTHDYQSIDELNEVFQAQVDKRNNTPVEDFLGLTPEQMYSLTRYDFKSNSDIVEFSGSVDEVLLRNVPLVTETLWLLEKLAEDDKGRKATQTGNLPRALVQEYFYTFNTDERLAKHLPQGEGDCYGISRTKLFLKDSGFIKFRNNYYSITRKGREMLDNTDIYSFYKEIFFWRAEKFNWLYYTGYPESYAYVQDTLIFNLFIVYKKAGGFVLGKELSEVYLTAFPHLEETKLPKFYGYTGLFLSDFCKEMGLVEENNDGMTEYESIFDSFYKTTTLFHELFVWHVK
ncbi:MAG: YecA family protein [Spirochaetota bacterium]